MMTVSLHVRIANVLVFSAIRSAFELNSRFLVLCNFGQFRAIRSPLPIHAPTNSVGARTPMGIPRKIKDTRISKEICSYSKRFVKLQSLYCKNFSLMQQKCRKLCPVPLKIPQDRVLPVYNGRPWEMAR